MCKHIALYLRVICIKKVSNSKSDLQTHSMSLAIMPFDRPYMISYLSSIVTMSVLKILESSTTILKLQIQVLESEGVLEKSWNMFHWVWKIVNEYRNMERMSPVCFFGVHILLNSILLGALPQTPLRKLTVLSQTL